MDSITSGKKLEKLLKEIKAKAANTELQIGVLEGATSSDGESLAERAADNEYGGDGPPRPFMRMTANKHGKEWTKQVGHLISNQNWDFVDALTVVGDIASKDMMDMVQHFPKNPPNSPDTIARKKEAGYNPFDQPLIETGDMVRSISFRVKS